MSTPATNQQVQTFSDQQVRPLAETIRGLQADIVAALGQIGDVYAALTEQSPTWTDQRTDGPPHLLQPADILAWNTFCTLFVAFCAGTLTSENMNAAGAQWPVILNACVRSLGA